MGSKRKGARTAASIYTAWDGFYDAAAAVERAFGPDSAKIYDKAFDEAMALPEEIMRQWFANVHYRTGRTKKAYIPGKTLARWDKNLEGYEYFRVYGYDKKKTVVPIFFEYGTPRKPPYHIKPEFVIYYAVADFRDVIPVEMARVMNREFLARKSGGNSE